MSLARPCTARKRALSSLSTGIMVTLCFLASRMISFPAITRVSLFASATCLPLVMAFKVGTRPAAPTIADTTMSASSAVAMVSGPSRPWIISGFCFPGSIFLKSRARASLSTETWRGLNSRICFLRRSRFVPAARAQTEKRSGKRRITSRVLTPIEPVEPRSDMCFIRQCPGNVGTLSTWCGPGFTRSAFYNNRSGAPQKEGCQCGQAFRRAPAASCRNLLPRSTV